MDLEDIFPSEISQIKTTVISLYAESKKKKISEYNKKEADLKI